MKKLLSGTMLLWTLLAAAPHVTFAESAKEINQPHWRRWQQVRGEKLTDIPELDGAVAGQALALLAGASVLLLDRARRKRA